MSDIPWLEETQRLRFPPAEEASEEGIVASGGNLSPGMLLSAYEQGVFPWFNSDDEPVLWWSPDPRFVLFPEELHISKSLKKTLKKKLYEITINKDFPSVIKQCALIKRPDQPGTWITDEMINSYEILHKLGHAYSVEAWDGEGQLVGGLYGVAVGKIFCGESMFALKPDASKAAFAVFVQHLAGQGFKLIDCQVYTENLERFGAKEIPRREYLGMLTSEK